VSREPELRLRPAVPADRDFARRIYVTTTLPYVGRLPGWTDDYVAARFEKRFVVETTRMCEVDGVTVGWLRLSETDDAIVLEQIYVDPTRQRQGIGSRLMRLLDDEWRGTRKPIRLAVLKTNPARHLYERFGFEAVEETGVAYRMRRKAPARP